jgi:hypothetical protein
MLPALGLTGAKLAGVKFAGASLTAAKSAGACLFFIKIFIIPKGEI